MSQTEIFWREGLDSETTRNRQGSEFYCWGGGQTVLAQLKRDGHLVTVVANGEMYLSVPRIYDGQLQEHGADVLRYTQDLEAYGLDTDLKIHQFTKQVCMNMGYEVWHMNNWFEVYDDEFPDGHVCDTLDDAIETAKAWLEAPSMV
jgi:hypothetical protein